MFKLVAGCVLAVGCSTQTLDRQACYAQAELSAVEDGLSECEGSESLADCEAWPAIEKRLQLDQEACP
jgi:hypothetical protein